MRPETFDTIIVKGDVATLPFVSLQSNGRVQAMTGFAVMSTLAMLIVLPQIAVACAALLMPSVRAALAQHPLAAFELAIALVFWTALICWPLRRYLLRINRRRTVSVTARAISVDDEHVFGTASWTETMAAFEGLAHHVRSSLSGTRHELVLVHPDPARTVVLYSREHMSDSECRHMADQLGLPMVASARLYAWRRLNPANAMPGRGVPATAPAGTVGLA